MNAVLIILLIANIVLICVNGKIMKEIKIHQNELKKAVQKKNIIEQYYKITKETSEKISKIKHNIKNQIQIAYATFQQNEIEGFNILKQIEEEVQDVKTVQYCKNNMLNAILSVKLAEAKKLDINIELVVDSAITLSMEDLDICDMFSNMIDNSIEAVKNVENRNIKIYIYQKTKYLIIKCENFYNKIIRAKNGNYKTTKIEKHKHGLRIKKYRKNCR